MARRSIGEDKNAYRFRMLKLKKGVHVQDPCVVGGILLKWNSKDGGVQTGLKRLSRRRRERLFCIW